MIPTTCSGRDLEQLLGLSSGRISQLRADGILRAAPKNPRAFLLAPSVSGYCAFLKSANAPTPFNEARADLVRAKAQIATIDLDERRGAVVPISDVLKSWAVVVSTVRMRLLSVPRQAAMRCGLVDPERRARLESVVEDLVHAALAELSDAEVVGEAAE
jgi:hypothetical protein